MPLKLIDWLKDPPPPLVFEISEAGVAAARMGGKSRLPESQAFAPLAAGAVESSPARENVHDPAELDRALRQALEQVGPGRKKAKGAALLLPDNCARVAVLEFENLPGDAAQRLALLRFRLKKTVPFDADTASLAYQIQRGAGDKAPSVLVAVSPTEVIQQYEAALRRAGLEPGYVSLSVAAALNLVTERGVTMLAKLAGRILSLVVIDKGTVRLARTLEVGGDGAPRGEQDWSAMAADLYPTFVYVADNFGSPVSKLALAGFGAGFPLAAEAFRRELGCDAEALSGPAGIVDAYSAGIWGYLSAN